MPALRNHPNELKKMISLSQYLAFAPSLPPLLPDSQTHEQFRSGMYSLLTRLSLSLSLSRVWMSNEINFSLPKTLPSLLISDYYPYDYPSMSYKVLLYSDTVVQKHIVSLLSPPICHSLPHSLPRPSIN